MNKFIVFILLLLAEVNAIFAADYRGKVVFSEDEKPVFGATIQLLDTLSNVYKGNKTNKSGEFSLKDVQYGKYTLKISYIGYKTIEFKYDLNSKSKLNFGAFKLEVEEKETDEVLVEAEAILGEMIADTSQFNARVVKVADDAMVNELLQKLPGMEVDANGKVTAEGKEVNTVLVDGKKFFGNDPKTVIENVPANIVDKVQVYDKNSESAEFSGKDEKKEEKAINIILQEDKKVGIFGQLDGGYGTENMYKSQVGLNFMNGKSRIATIAWLNNNSDGVDASQIYKIFQGGGHTAVGSAYGALYGYGSSMFSTGSNSPVYQPGYGDSKAKNNLFAGVNYSDEFGKNVETNVFYMLKKNSSESRRETEREYLIGENADRLFNQSGHGSEVNWSHDLSVEVKAKIDTLNRIKITPSVSYSDNKIGSYSTTANMYRNGSKLNEAETDYYSSGKVTNFVNEIDYTHEFKKEGRRVSLELSQDFSEEDGFATQKGTINYYLQNQIDTLNQKADIYRKNSTLSANLSASEPISKRSTINLDYDVNYNKKIDNRKTNIFDNNERKYSILDSNMSSDFDSDILKNDLRLQYALLLGDKDTEYFRTRASLKYSTADLEGKRSIPSGYDVNYDVQKLLPSIDFEYSNGDGLDVELRYSYSYNMPDVSALNEVADNSDPLSIYIGNRNLKVADEKSIDIETRIFSDDYKKYFYINGAITWVDNYQAYSRFEALNDTVINGIDLKNGTQLTRPVNLDGRLHSYCYFGYSFPLPISILSGNINGSVSYNELPTIMNGKELLTKEFRTEPGLSIWSKFSKDFSLSLYGTYSFNRNQNPLNKGDDSYQKMNLGLYLDWKFFGGFFINGSYNTTFYYGMYYDSGDFDVQNLNFSVGYKFLKNDACKISLSFYDVLNKTANFNTNISDYYTEFVRYKVNPQYIMLNMSWKFNSLGADKKDVDVDTMMID